MLSVDYVFVSCKDRVICRQIVEGVPFDSVEFRSAQDVEDYARTDRIFSAGAKNKALAEVLALRREPWTATVSTSYQGFPIQLPERLMSRRVRVTIEDLGPAD